MWLIGSFNIATLEAKHHHPRPAIVETATKEAAPGHSQVANEASPAKDDVSPVKHHKPKVLARQRNNNVYGNALGYAEEYRNDSRGFFIH
jgi:hypothetical protein